MDKGANIDSDGEQLAALGYTSEFNRSMSLWANFALGFTYLSPVVGAYSLFAFGVQRAGPPMIWSYVAAGCGMMMVCLVFGEVVSQFPIAGGVYPWARRLVGRKWSWLTGWIYGWAMYSTIAGVAVGAASFVGPLIGVPVTPGSTTIIALITIFVATVANLAGTRTLAKIAMLGFCCEVAGALLVGGYLLLFRRAQPVTALITDYGFSSNGSFLPALLAASIVGMFCCFGFEACGDLAEETPEPGRSVPVAMRMTIYIGIAVTVFSVSGLLLAIPDMQAVVRGRIEEPIAYILISAFGPVGYKVILSIVLVSFISCVLSLQAAVSRLVYSYARDRMIAGSVLLSRMSPNTHVPVPSLILAGLVPAAVVCTGLFMQNALTTIVSFAAVGIYIAFEAVIIAAAYARLRGWVPSGQFRLGRWAWPVNILALSFGVGAVANVVWPRAIAGAPWYIVYGQFLSLAVVLGAGCLYLFAVRPHLNSNAPAGDAWIIFRGPRSSPPA